MEKWVKSSPYVATDILKQKNYVSDILGGLSGLFSQTRHSEGHRHFGGQTPVMYLTPSLDINNGF